MRGVGLIREGHRGWLNLSPFQQCALEAVSKSISERTFSGNDSGALLPTGILQYTGTFSLEFTYLVFLNVGAKLIPVNVTSRSMYSTLTEQISR